MTKKTKEKNVEYLGYEVYRSWSDIYPDCELIAAGYSIGRSDYWIVIGVVFEEISFSKKREAKYRKEYIKDVKRQGYSLDNDYVYVPTLIVFDNGIDTITEQAPSFSILEEKLYSEYPQFMAYGGVFGALNLFEVINKDTNGYLNEIMAKYGYEPYL